MNIREFDVPLAVVIVTGTEVEVPVIGGTVTEHDVSLGQLVGAVCPPKLAVISPFELMKLEPVTANVWPAES